jgi:hypothetical protein
MSRNLKEVVAMKKSIVALLALAGCILLVAPQSALARTPIMNDWVAFYSPCQPLVSASCTACHMNGTDFNPYGADLRTAIDGGMTNEEAFFDIEGDDSDGDGYSNGQEIVVDCTMPGDDTDFGTVADVQTSWGQIKALFR